MDNVRYVTSRGESISLLKPPIIINTKQFREFMFEIQNRKLLFAKEKTFEVPAALVGTSKVRDELLDKLVYDSEVGKLGRLYVNNWFIYCNFSGISSVIAENNKGARVDLNFYVPNVEWLREVKYELFPQSDEIAEGLNFPYNPPHNYTAKKRSVSRITNPKAVDADFILEFSGNAESVEFGIGDTIYKVKTTVTESEKFYLNTYTREVYKVRDGLSVDLFPYADDETYIFTKVPNGEHNVYWQGEFSMDITMLERRRFPPWT